eukprot:NODE_214_length_14327_cov_0.392325.p4 type:complete len:350 gc:universal NODE_214_length_14327_cov_0.392325:4383-3334(-)
MDLQNSFLKVPIELLKKANRLTLKWVEKEIKQPQTYNKDRLKKLKSKLLQTSQDELLQASIVEKRINHLAGVEKQDQYELHTRLNRWLVDYFVYLKSYQSAHDLMQKSDLTNLCDVNLFKELQNITQKLEQHDCTLLLAWCFENRALLKKNKSGLEFRCRQQEYVHIIKSNRTMDAIAYAREHFTAFANDNQQDIYHLMGLLTTKLDTKCSIYYKFLDNSQWDTLITQFQADFASIHGLTQHPILILSLQAGLAALKTQTCHPDKHPHCPVCTPDLHSFSEKLPFSHRTNTCLRCPISGTVMNEHNLPMVLPSGFVVSEMVILFNQGMYRNDKRKRPYKMWKDWSIVSI